MRSLVSRSMVAVSGLAAVAALLPAQDVQRSALHDFRLITVATGLENPWSLAFLPGGEMLVTERAGRLRVIRNGQLVATPVTGVPAVRTGGQGGLLDVVAHPSFAQNRFVYISYSKPLGENGAQGTTAVIRGRYENGALTDVREIIEVAAVSAGRGHYGSRLAFDRDGFLFITVGDRQAPPSGDLERHPAQDLMTHAGKILRLHDDGRVPADNPFVGRTDARPEIWSYGHRSLQGLMVHPVTGALWETEHGPQGGDELNLIEKGKNYGWPVIGFGVNYRSGAAIHAGTHREGMEQPVNVWVPSIATSGLMAYTGDRFPNWNGNIFSGGMVGQRLARLTMDGNRLVSVENLVQNQGRIRDVRQGPDGFIYLVFDNRGDGTVSVARMEPAAR
jgi:glucose/arabinose dehydrogenase